MSQIKRGKRKFKRYFDNPEEGHSSRNSDNDSPANRKPPKGLKGREIGLWYAKRSRERLLMGFTDEQREKMNKDREVYKELIQKRVDQRPLGNILLSEAKKENITRLLNETAIVNPSLLNEKSNSYAHLEETDFKHEFLQHINGSIIKKLQSTHCNSSIHQNEILDDLFLKELEHKGSTKTYQKMQEFRKNLPAMKMKDELLNLINKNQVVVISGETGCGKTTQVSQFILDDYIKQGRGSLCKIICTQPRRISAISVAERVAEERDEPLGISSGFQIRMEKKLPRDRGSILYCTTGVLLKFMEGDPSLSEASHLILDEIHERDVISDFLITVLKDVITYRNDIKVILMSATLNAEAFSKYYHNAPHINIPGFTFPVADFYLEDVLQKTKYKFKKNTRRVIRGKDYYDYIEPHIRQLEAEKLYDKEVLDELRFPESERLDLQLIYELLKYVCNEANEKESVLIFVPGFADIQGLINKITNSKDFPFSKYITIPLHSQLPTVDQKQIFLPAPKGKRKIIVATNIAETSITIEDVGVVIDSGFIKISHLDPETGIESLKIEWVSCANAAQRRGRAGRVKSGVCYHLFSKARYLLLDKFLKPEILRKSLEDVILQLKMLQLGDAEPFLARLMDPPEPSSVKASINLLQRLGALDENELLTPLGLHMAKLPVGAQCSKMLIMGALFSCLDPILSVAASLGFKDAFQLNVHDVKEADKKRRELSKGTNSDHLLMHYAIREFEESSAPYAFCRKYFLSISILRQLQDIRKQFAQLLFDMKFIQSKHPKDRLNNCNSDNISLVKAIIASGLYPNVAIQGKKLRSITHEPMKFHPKSVLFQTRNGPSPLVVYQVRLKSSDLFIHDGTFVFPLPIIFFGDQFKRIQNDQDDDRFVGISINGTMRFLCSQSTASIIEKLRERLNHILESKISNPGFVDWKQTTPEIKILRAIMEMITSEDMEDLDLSDYDDC